MRPGSPALRSGKAFHLGVDALRRQLATVEGLSNGRLAAELGISKSGLYAHFGSKEEV